MATTKKPPAKPQGVGAAAFTADSFVNPLARLGKGQANLSSADTYSLNPITRERALLDWMYRGSWVIGVGVDAVAEDMTREGVEFTGTQDPEILDALNEDMVELDIWTAYADAVKWARLYGGAIMVMLIDGQDMESPLDVDTIKPGQFKGLFTFERWLLNPVWGNLISDLGPTLGKPEYYQPTAEAPVYRGVKIHHTRCIRIDGITLPFYQRMAEAGWGMSIVERVYDRLTAFDSTTVGAAQLIHKSYLRTLKVQGLREILAGGGAMLNALNANFDMIRAMQQAEGLTLIDARDDFQTHQYAFQGLSDILLQFGQQIAGAFQVPLVRFFGTSPVGMNSTGESDFRLYYDGIGREQERKRAALGRLFKVMYRSRIGENPWKSFGFNFRPLWKVSRAEKAQIGQQKTATILSTLEAAVIGRKTALQELRQQSAETGLFSNITDEMIDEADEDPPPPSEAIEAGKQAAGAEGGKGTKPKPDDFEGKPDALGA